MALNSPTITVPLNAQRSIEWLLRPTFTDHEITQSFRVLPNLFSGAIKLGIMEQMEDIVRKSSGCASNPRGEFKLTERELLVNYADVEVEWCYEELQNTHYDNLAPLFSTQNGTPNLNALTNLLLMQIRQGMKLDIHRVSWFGDSNSDKASMDWATGAWTRIKKIKDNGTIAQYVDSSSGTELTPLQAFELLREVVRGKKTNKAIRNYNKSQQVIHINGDLWESILTYLETSAISNGFIKVFEESKDLKKGVYRGIPIMVHDSWDVNQSKYLGLENQNLILHTVQGNLVVGSDLRENAAGSQATTNLKIDTYHGKVGAKSKFVFDTNIVHPELCSVAY